MKLIVFNRSPADALTDAKKARMAVGKAPKVHRASENPTVRNSVLFTVCY